MVLRFGPIELDVDAFELRSHGERVHVEPQVFDVVCYLVDHRDRLVSKEELLEQVWGTRFVTPSALTSRIKAARRALGDDGRRQRVIRTVHGRGYQFVAPVEGEEDATLRGVTTVDGARVAGRPSHRLERPALLEREEAVEVLDAALHDAAGGQGRVVLVSGEAGIGKTSLVRALLARSVEGRVLVGGCDDLVVPRPLGPLHDIAPAARPGLARALADPAPGAIQQAVLAELEEGPSPTVLVVEDVHWADEATIDLLIVTARRIAALPAVLVLTYRDAEVGGAHPLASLLGSIPAAVGRHISLEPLSPSAVAELVGPARADEVVALTGGVPFFVTEVAALGPEDVGTRLPTSVAHAVQARMARLPAPTRRILDLLAVEPSRTDVAVLDQLVPSWMVDLEPAERLAMITVTSQSVAFRHELARRAALDALPAARRRALHREVAAALVVAGADPARVVHHAEAGGDRELLVVQALLAARRATAVAAQREAWSHYQRVVPLVDLLDAERLAGVLEEASRAAYAAGDGTAALQLGLRALEASRRSGDDLAIGRVHRWLSRIHWYQGRRLESEVQAQLAVKLLEPLAPSVELAWAYSNLSQLAMLAWRDDDTTRWGERAIELAQALGAEDVVVHALVNVGAMRVKSDETDESTLWEAIARAEAAGEHHEVVRGIISVGFNRLDGDHPGLAAEATQRGLRYAEQYEVESLREYLVAMLGRIAVLEGRWDEADELLRAVVHTRSPVTYLFALTSLALLEVRRGDPNAAATLAHAWPLAEAAGEAQRIIPLAEAEAEHAWLSGRLDPSTRHLQDAYALASRARWCTGRLARWCQEAGLAAEAIEREREPYRAELEGRWSDAAAEWRARGMPYEAARALARTGPKGWREAIRIAAGLGAGPLLDRLRGLGEP